MNNEVWKQITDYPNYFISNTGKVRNVKTGRELQQYLLPNGYLQIVLCKNGKTKSARVHRLVAQAFIPNPDNLDTVDHRNGLKTDNRAENLRWLSRQDNTSRFYREQATEEWKEHFKLTREKGVDVHKKPVICLENGKVYESTKQASEKLNLFANSITRVCKGELKTTGGYHFKYLF